MAQFIAGMLELLFLTAGLVLLHQAGKGAPTKLFREAV